MLEWPVVPLPVQPVLRQHFGASPWQGGVGVMELCLCWLRDEITWGCLPLSGAVLFSRKLQYFC